MELLSSVPETASPIYDMIVFAPAPTRGEARVKSPYLVSVVGGPASAAPTSGRSASYRSMSGRLASGAAIRPLGVCITGCISTIALGTSNSCTNSRP